MMLQSDDVKIETMGITMPGNFKPNKAMACNKLGSPEYRLTVRALPTWVNAGGCKATASMACKDVPRRLPQVKERVHVGIRGPHRHGGSGIT